MALTDAGAKRALWVTILLGLLLGGLWGGMRYGLTNPRAWNLAGLGVIVCVALYAGLVALAGARKPNG